MAQVQKGVYLTGTPSLTGTCESCFNPKGCYHPTIKSYLCADCSKAQALWHHSIDHIHSVLKPTLESLYAYYQATSTPEGHRGFIEMLEATIRVFDSEVKPE